MDASLVDDDGDLLVLRRQVRAFGSLSERQTVRFRKLTHARLNLCYLLYRHCTWSQAKDHSDDELVLSEVHIECVRPNTGTSTTTTVFSTTTEAEFITLRHTLATPLRSVGLQVWRGGLLLSDYLLLQASKGLLAGCTALELGAGPGLAGLVLSRCGAATVFLTGAGARNSGESMGLYSCNAVN
jgi:hypothetical protein